MHSTQLLKVLAAALTTFSAAHAAVAGPQAARIPEAFQIVKRQSASSSTTQTSTTATTTRPPATTTPTTTPPPTTPTPTTPTTAPTSRATSNAETTPGPAPTTSAAQTTSTPDSSDGDQSTTSQVTKTTVLTVTNSDGSLSTQTSQIVQSTTVPVDKGKQNTGMDEAERNRIIGGVVGGVGGAIFLAVIGLVCWRVWGRKKNHEDVDNSFGTSAYNVADKPEPTSSSTNSRTPFQSTLESYHAPTQVNTASNF